MVNKTARSTLRQLVFLNHVPDGLALNLWG
jgi:hypothetical protein